MFQFLLRTAMLIVGMVLVLDVVLPTVSQAAQVDRHASSADQRSHDTRYRIDLAGTRAGSCSVGYSAYADLRDGDEVVVESSPIFKTCVRILRREQLVYVERYWRLFATVGGLMLIAAGFGWVRPDDDDRWRLA